LMGGALEAHAGAEDDGKVHAVPVHPGPANVPLAVPVPGPPEDDAPAPLLDPPLAPLLLPRHRPDPSQLDPPLLPPFPPPLPPAPLEPPQA
jgi:hypothetical protein